MNERQNDFVQLVDRATRDSKFEHLRHAIVKELLIYDILFCLDQLDLLNDIVFQGGTLLRLVHGSKRLSEDLDFAAGENFSISGFNTFKTGIENFFFQRYRLIVEVNEPKNEFRSTESGVTVNRWRINVTMYPARKDVPKVRVKLEVANVPAHTRELKGIRSHYDFLPDGYDDILIQSESLNEVMADKLISFPASTRYVRYRDIWDLYWLSKGRAEIDRNLVRQKLIDYQLSNYADLLTKKIEHLPEIVNSPEFHVEMSNLLPSDVYENSMRKDKFCTHMLITVQGLFEDIRNFLN